ncbi:MAG: phospho-sugar mutase, partial [Clostridia bacterium]|nr:phospho-sugar mutase [Clostridia bacterium]
GGIKVEYSIDYSTLKVTYADGSEKTMDSTKTNAVYYGLEGGGFICVRPSGTEPKLKVYYSLPCKNEKVASEIYAKVKADFESLLA